MKKYCLAFALAIFLVSSAAFPEVPTVSSSSEIIVSAAVEGFLDISMDTPPVFNLIDNNGYTIPSKDLGAVTIKSNYGSSKVMIASFNQKDSTHGQLVYTSERTTFYIPYTFNLVPAGSLDPILQEFNSYSSSIGRTPRAGKQFALSFYFEDPGNSEMWQTGTYTDTITITVSVF